MGGIGKWVKKNPLQAAGLLAGAAVGGPALMGLLSPAAAATGAGIVEGAGVLGGAAEGGGGAFAGLSGATSLPAQGGFLAGMDKMAPYAKLANMGMGMVDQPQSQVPQIAPPQLRGPGQPLSPTPMYGGGGGMYGALDPEEEKRRLMMAYLAQQQGVA